VSKTSVFEHLEIQVNFSARNFFLKRSFCTEVCILEQTSCAQSATVEFKHFDMTITLNGGSVIMSKCVLIEHFEQGKKLKIQSFFDTVGLRLGLM